MSKKNKVIYSDIQPNPKEAGLWVNTSTGNIMVEKDNKWVDDSASTEDGGGSSNVSILKYYKVETQPESGDRSKLAYNAYEVLYTTDNGITMNRLNARGAGLNDYNTTSSLSKTKAFSTIASDVDWLNKLTIEIEEISEQMYDDLKQEY